MNTYTVSIGRNVADIAMGDEMWNGFVIAVQTVLTPNDSEAWLETHIGNGHYGATREESAMVTLLTDVALGAGELLAVRVALKILAGVYGQESIALTVGTSELIFA